MKKSLLIVDDYYWFKLVICRKDGVYCASSKHENYLRMRSSQVIGKKGEEEVGMCFKKNKYYS